MLETIFDECVLVVVPRRANQKRERSSKVGVAERVDEVRYVVPNDSDERSRLDFGIRDVAPFDRIPNSDSRSRRFSSAHAPSGHDSDALHAQALLILLDADSVGLRSCPRQGAPRAGGVVRSFCFRHRYGREVRRCSKPVWQVSARVSCDTQVEAVVENDSIGATCAKKCKPRWRIRYVRATNRPKRPGRAHLDFTRLAERLSEHKRLPGGEQSAKYPQMSKPCAGRLHDLQ